MKKIKFDSNYVLMGIFILITGVLLGINISTRGTFALEGTQTQVATSSNATATNATATNATAVNATSTNATSANASRTDNILYLNEFSLTTESAKPGEKVYVGKMTTGACNSGMSIEFVDSSNNSHFSVNVESMNSNPYFIVPKNALSGKYQATTILMVGLNSDGSTFNKKYTYETTDSTGSTPFNFDVKLTINNENAKSITLTKIALVETKIKVGEKVSVNYTASDKLTSLRLFFKSSEDSFNVTVLDLDKNSYFDVPSTTKKGEYELVKAILMTEESSTVYENGQNYSFDSKLTVEDNDQNTYIYNNSEINEEIIKKLYDDSEVNEIIVNIDNNSIVSEDLFKVIIGTDKKLVINTNNNQIIFNGRDVNSPKAIDATMNTLIASDDESISNHISNGIIVNFVSNGNLPGNALIRLKATEKIQNTLGNKKVNVYYYDAVKDGFNTIAEGISLKDGYYEFAISHNSKYVLTTTKLDKSLIFEEEDNSVVNFRQSNRTYLAILCIALILILVVIIILLNLNNKKRKN